MTPKLLTVLPLLMLAACAQSSSSAPAHRDQVPAARPALPRTDVHLVADAPSTGDIPDHSIRILADYVGYELLDEHTRVEGNWQNAILLMTYRTVEVQKGEFPIPRFTFLLHERHPTRASGIKLDTVSHFRKGPKILFYLNKEGNRYSCIAYQQQAPNKTLQRDATSQRP